MSRNDFLAGLLNSAKNDSLPKTFEQINKCLKDNNFTEIGSPRALGRIASSLYDKELDVYGGIKWKTGDKKRK